MIEYPLEVAQAMADEKRRLRSALEQAQQALHRACLELGSTEGYRADFDAINRALDETQAA